jgi:amino acid transporter
MVGPVDSDRPTMSVPVAIAPSRGPTYDRGARVQSDECDNRASAKGTELADTRTMPAPSPPVAAGKTGYGTFTRASSGLVRELSTTDMAWFGIFAAGSVYNFLYIFPGPQAASQGVSLPLLCLFLFLFAVPVFWVYATLGSAMPRAGGDYIYESRTLIPLIGFVIPWVTQILFQLALPAGGGLVVAQFGLSPIFAELGAHGVANWFAGQTGTFVTSVVCVLICLGVSIAGLRFVRATQRFVLVPLTIVGVAAIYVVLIAHLGDNFAHKFAGTNGNGVTVASVSTFAAKQGYVDHGISIGKTLLWMCPLGGLVAYTMFAAQGMLGEVKQAANTRRLFGAFTVAGAVQAFVIMGLPLLLLVHIVGGKFLDEYAIASANGMHLTAPPNLIGLLEVLTGSKLLIILIALGFLAAGLAIPLVTFLCVSRIVMAMGFDGTIPSAFGDVSERFHSPVKATAAWAILALIIIYIFNYKPSWQTPILLGGTTTGVLVLGVTATAATLFPYRSKTIYSAAPAPVKRKLFGIPLVTIVGAIGALTSFAMVVIGLTTKQLGLENTTAQVLLVGAFVTGVLIFYGWRAWQARRGVDLGLAFRELPPD